MPPSRVNAKSDQIKNAKKLAIDAHKCWEFRINRANDSPLISKFVGKIRNFNGFGGVTRKTAGVNWFRLEMSCFREKCDKLPREQQGCHVVGSTTAGQRVARWWHCRTAPRRRLVAIKTIKSDATNSLISFSSKLFSSTANLKGTRWSACTSDKGVSTAHCLSEWNHCKSTPRWSDQYVYVGFFRRKIPRTSAYTIAEKAIRFWHPDYDPDRAQKLISSSMSRHLSTRNISSKSMYAFLSNLANGQTDKQTRAKTCNSSFVGGKNAFDMCVLAVNTPNVHRPMLKWNFYCTREHFWLDSNDSYGRWTADIKAGFIRRKCNT